MRFARALHLGLSLATFSSLALLTSTANASEPFPGRAERLQSPGRDMVGEDSGEAVVLNPANLAFMTGRELRWTYVRCPDTDKVNCGHSFDLASKLPLNFGGAFRVDFVQPESDAGFPFNGTDYVWLTLGLARKFNEQWAFGATAQWSYSTNTYTNGLFGITAGLTYRPNTHFGFAITANDFNGPSTSPLPPNGNPVLGRSYALGAAFRPLGNRTIELGGELHYYEQFDEVRPRMTLGVDVNGFGRLRGDVEVQELANDDKRGVLATAGLEISFDRFSLGGGALFGSALGSSTAVGEYFTASISNTIQPGVPRPERAVYIRMESTPGARAHAHLLERLWRIADDKEIVAVTMEMRAEPAASFAHAEELADAFRLLKAKGKRVICSFEDAGPRALYACASANRIVINPAGGIRYSGLKTEHMYLAGVMKKIGVHAEFVKIGAHKSAPEEFTNEHASDTAKADQEDLLRNVEAVFNRNLSLYRHLPEDKIRDATARGPFVASEAKDAGFVDGTAFDDELERVTQDVVGRKVKFEKYEDEHFAPKVFGAQKKLGMIYVDGEMIDGHSRTIPLLGTKLVGSYTIAETAKKMREDNDIKAVVLRIESPGGSSLAADVMWRELKLLAEKKPLIVSMGSVAASGGYYIASAGHSIFALPLTITGSIGIFYGKADVTELLGKIGVNVDVRKTSPRADFESPYRPFTKDELTEMDHKIHQFYDVFLDRVAQGRHMSKEDVDAVGQGRVWVGQQALGNHLVDRMGGLRTVLEAAREAGGLPEDCPIEESSDGEKTILEQAIQLAGLHQSIDITQSLPASLREVARSIAPMAIYDDATPLARMEWTPTDDTSPTDDDE